MKKKLILLLLAALLVLTGCPRDEAQEPAETPGTQPPAAVQEAPEETTTEEPTTLPPETEPPIVVELEEKWIPFLSGRRMSAEQYFIYDINEASFVLMSGRVDQTLYPASITKLFTAYVALQYIDPAEKITAGSELTLIDPHSSVAKLQQGDTLTVEQLVEAMMLPSGNDATYVLTAHVGRLLAEDPEMGPRDAINRFVEQMNAQAEELGMRDSHFVTPDGIHNSEHYVTIADLIIVSRLALKDPIISKYVGVAQETIPMGGDRELTWKNTNLLLHPDSMFYNEYTIGMKTGFTSAAGNCLLTAFRVGEQELLIGVFGCDNADERFAETLLLFARYYDLEIPVLPPEETIDFNKPTQSEEEETTEETTEATEETTEATQPESTEGEGETTQPDASQEGSDNTQGGDNPPENQDPGTADPGTGDGPVQEAAA